jgi:aryl-alcohol dehydrogenase-like predicted oxidoreductase
MTYKQLGNSSLQVSQVSFGCMSLENDQQQVTGLIHNAIAAGINYFDTADLYGNGLNEELIGNALQEKRKEVFIATKVGNEMNADGKSWQWNPRKEYILQAIDNSLQRLKTDYIDLYQLHGGTMEDPIDETIEAFELLVQQGKIRYYGISSIRPAVIKEWGNRSKMVSVMTQYGLADRRAENEILDYLHENNIAVMVRGALAKGMVAGKTPAAFADNSAERMAILAERIAHSSGAERNASQTAMRFALIHPAVTSLVVGIRTGKQLADATALFNTPPLTEQQVQYLIAD